MYYLLLEVIDKNMENAIYVSWYWLTEIALHAKA